MTALLYITAIVSLPVILAESTSGIRVSSSSVIVLSSSSPKSFGRSARSSTAVSFILMVPIESAGAGGPPANTTTWLAVLSSSRSVNVRSCPSPSDSPEYASTGADTASLYLASMLVAFLTAADISTGRWPSSTS